MSVCTVAVISTASLIKFLLISGGMMAASAAGGAALGKIVQTREDRESLRHNVLKEIAALDGRASRADDEAAVSGLRLRLARTRESVENDSMSDASAQNIFAELDEISLELRRAEIDAKQCRARAESILASLDRYVTAGDLTPDERAGFEKEMSGASRMSASERLSELARVSEKLTALIHDKIAAGGGENPWGRAAYDEIRRDIRDFASRISTLDETEGRRAEAMAQKAGAETKFPDKLEDLRRQVKILWGTVREREASTSFFRDTLNELKNDLSNAGKSFATPEGMKLMQRCDATRGAKYIERADFMNLYEDLARYTAGREKEIADALFAGKVKEALEELGYDILEDIDGASGADTLVPGEVRYLESPYDGYRVMTKIDAGGSLTARLVRIAENDEQTGGSEASDNDASDSEAGAKWCADFDRFLDKMRQEGLPMDVTLRKEPGEAEIITITDAAAQKTRGTRKTRKKRRRASGMNDKSGGALEAGGENR
jgi:hypothetical protein